MTSRRALCLSFITLVVAASILSAADWPQLRGPQRDGRSAETNLVLEWPETGPKELWRHPIGTGYSAVSVVGDRLYTAYADDSELAEGEQSAGQEFAVALDAATGDEIWRVVLGAKTFDEFGHGPRATPSVDGDLVVFLGGLGRLTALKTENGGQLWQVDIRETYGTDRPTYGFASSAVIEGGLVMLDIGAGEGRSHIALDRATGKLLWAGGTPGHGKQPGYSSVLPVDLSGERQLVHLAGQELRSVDLDGTENWSFEWPQGESHSMPIFVPPNRIYASGAAPIGAIMVQIAAGDEGYTVEEVWRTHLMRNHFSSSVYHEGHLYGFDNATLKCFDAANGEQKWAKRGLGKGTLIVVEGHLIIVSDRGRLLVAEATPGGFTETGSVQALTGKSWTAPSLANGVLYLRNQTEIVAYDLRPEAGS